MTAIYNLGTIEQLIDASDVDDGPMLDDTVHGMPQPDGLASYIVGETPYLVTANEGDARANLAMDLGEHGIEGNPFIDTATLDALRETYGGSDPTDEEILGKLGVSTIDTDTDTDGDGDIDILTMFGTRSFSILNAETGERVFDSGSEFAMITLDRVPDLFNGGTSARTDSRSDNKGSEPESIVLGEIGDRIFAFIGLERTGGVMMYDVTDPNDVSFVDYINTHAETESQSPEGSFFLSGESSPDGGNYLLIGYDRSDSIEVYRVVSEPSTIGLLSLGMILSICTIRRFCCARTWSPKGAAIQR